MDLALLVVFPVFAVFITEIFHLSIAPSAFFFYGIPALYFCFKKPSIFAKSLIFSFVVTIGISWALGHMIYLDKIWFVPSTIRFLQGTVTLDEIVWGFLWTFFIIVFWEYFLDHDKNKLKVSPKFRYLTAFLVIQLVGFFILYFWNHSVLVQPYFYLKFGLIMMASMILIAIIRFPKLIKKVSMLGLYFLFVSILNEYVGLKYFHWSFPGNHYLGLISFDGHRLPWDEVIFWWILGAPGMICWYEIFADDKK